MGMANPYGGGPQGPTYTPPGPTFTPMPAGYGQPMPPGGPTYSPMPANMMTGDAARANAIMQWPPTSTYVKCLSCQRSGFTRVSRTIKPIALVLAIFGFFFIFVFSLLVFCFDCSYNYEHNCSTCGCHLGTCIDSDIRG